MTDLIDAIKGSPGGLFSVMVDDTQWYIWDFHREQGFHEQIGL